MKQKVIILEDDDLIRSSITFFLETLGYEVQAYSDPLYYQKYLNNNCKCQQKIACADIIITDINMPGETGLEFIKHQKQNGCKVKNIAVMSGEWTELYLNKAKQLGCKIFQKPFDLKDLINWLDKCKNPENISFALQSY